VSVITIEGETRGSLAITRSLGMRDIDVTVGSYMKHCTSFFSKYCKNKIIYSRPEINCSEFIKVMLDIVKRGKYDVIYPITEFTTIPLSYYKNKFSPYINVPIPSYEMMIKAHDKSQTIKIAIENDIPCPKTYFVKNVKEVKSISKNIEFPVVIKPRCKTSWLDDKAILTKVTPRNYANSPEELISRYSVVHNATEFPLIQEYIPGTGYGVEVLCNQGDPRAVFMHKRLREYPVEGGVSTLRESVSDKRMEKIALKILKVLNWHGVAMVEFKVDERDKRPKLIEINGRFWGSLNLAIASGVDFPYLLHTMVMEGDVKPVFSYKLGVKGRWLLPGDFLYLFSALSHAPRKLHILREFLKFRDMTYDISSFNDPLPTLGALNVTFQQAKDVLTGKREISGEIKK